MPHFGGELPLFVRGFGCDRLLEAERSEVRSRVEFKEASRAWIPASAGMTENLHKSLS
jgi:hypothetical protein